MKIGFLINDINTEKNNYTTIRLTRRALSEGYDVSLISIAGLTYKVNGEIQGLATKASGRDYSNDTELLAELQSNKARKELVNLSSQHVLMLRADPADELISRPWAPSSSLLFAQLAAKAGLIVLNDPYHLMNACNKTYYQQYPVSVRPKTCITRDANEIKAFIEREGKAIIKPLQGSGGRGVFMIDDGSSHNTNQIIDATIRDGYAIVQEYLPKAAEGDLRLITLNGAPLKVDGVHACFKRFNDTGDIRSNITAGGNIEMAEPTPEALEIAEVIGPKLIHDGMYLSGLDIVGDKMMEVNVDTPGGITMAEDLTGKDFSGAILADLERKVSLRKFYRYSDLSNRDIAMI